MARMIKQLYIERQNNRSETSFSGIIYSIGIHALPGTMFKINNNENSIITIGPTGNFSLSCEEHPLQSISLCEEQPLTTVTYPTIIDIVCEGGNNNEQ